MSIFVRRVRFSDIPRLLEIDKSRYPVDWLVEPEWAEKVFLRGNKNYSCVEKDGVVEAYYAIVSVSLYCFEGLLSGKLGEKDIHKYLQLGTKFNYISSIVGVEDRDPEGTKLLLQDLDNYINLRTSKGEIFSSTVISPHGERVLTRSGFVCANRETNLHLRSSSYNLDVAK